MKIETLAVDFTVDEQKRYLEAFYLRPADQQGRARLRWRHQAGKVERRADRTRIRPHQGAGQAHGSGQEARRSGKVQTRTASVRCLSAARSNRRSTMQPPKSGRQLPLALFWPVLCRAGAGLLHVPVAHRQRHPETLAVRRIAGRSGRAPVRAVLPCHHAATNRQVREIPPKLRGGADRGGPGPRGFLLARLRLGQHPQRHGNADGRDRSGRKFSTILRPYAREWHYHILNDRSLTGLPRKFNVAFDGAGKIAVLEDTNDIAFCRGRGERRVLASSPASGFGYGSRRHHSGTGILRGLPASS